MAKKEKRLLSDLDELRESLGELLDDAEGLEPDAVKRVCVELAGTGA